MKRVGPSYERMATGIFQAVTAIDWISSRRFPFTVEQFQEAMEIGKRQAYRILAAAELNDWVRIEQRPKSKRYFYTPLIEVLPREEHARRATCRENRQSSKRRAG